MQTCIHSIQGFSLFKVVIICDVTSNTMLFLLVSKGTAIYFFFSKPKKKMLRGSGRSQEFIKRPHLNKMAAPTFLFVRIDSMQHVFPSFFHFWCYQLLLIRGHMHWSWFWRCTFSAAPQSAVLFLHPVEGALMWVESKDHPFVIQWLPSRERATPGPLVHVGPFCPFAAPWL